MVPNRVYLLIIWFSYSEHTAAISLNTLGPLDIALNPHLQSSAAVTYADAANTDNPISTTQLGSGCGLFAAADV
ncbi:hypothetical protein BJX62DRAFT_201152 [Aspergillus germanicus]